MSTGHAAPGAAPGPPMRQNRPADAEVPGAGRPSSGRPKGPMSSEFFLLCA